MGDFILEKNMNENNEFLNYIFKNAEMGVIGINNVVTKLKDDKFINLLQKQKEEYKLICGAAENLLGNNNQNPEEIGVMARVCTNLMSDMKIMGNDNVKKIAKMMIEGTNKGIIEITEKLNEYKHVDKEVINLAEKLKKVEENSIDELKKYL